MKVIKLELHGQLVEPQINIEPQLILSILIKEYLIREMNFTSGKLRIEVAQFTPTLSATGQINLRFDEKATQFAVQPNRFYYKIY